MATQNINIGINISDNGTAKKVIKDVNQLHSAIKATQESAQKVAAPKAGYKAAAQPTGTEAQLSNQEYNRGRGSMGTTGASARDFANQAQGLGGLVRLYATYAANIFAVGAAFRALSNAMDTANLVRGLDQLGAASGTALGSLSKRLVQTTDGAISLREAMEATAKASSSGMSSENILRMGKVAKQASQALGVDMADAVNRLTRGITKLEPELLDEIGIFTKVDKATEDYAKSIGKSTSAITDFEKRMAFANAVLAEGEKKFSAVNFDTNPYTKLLATLKDVSQTGLELVNKILGPLVSFMSESPKALGLAIAALGTILVKQALPALGQFKAGLSRAAEETAKEAAARAKDARDASNRADALLLADREKFAQAQIDKLNIAADQLKEAGIKRTQAAAKLLAMDFASLDAKNVKDIESGIKRVNIEADRYARLAKKAEQVGRDPETVAQLKAKEEAYRNAAYAAKSSLAAEQAYSAGEQQTKKKNMFVTLQATAAEKARIVETKQAIVTNAAYNGSLIGPISALRLMSAELVKADLQLGTFSKGLLYTRAGFAAFVGAIGSLVGKIAGALNVIAVLGAAIGLAVDIFSKNQKELAAFNSAVDASESSIANLGRTLDAINKKPFGEQLSTASLMAVANAVNEISLSLNTLVRDFNRAEAAQGGFDRFLDKIKGIFGQDLKSRFARTLGTTIFDALEEVADSPGANKAKNELAAILKVDPNLDKEAWIEATEQIVDNKRKLRELIIAYEDFAKQQSQVAGKAEDFDNAMKKSKEALRDFTNEFKLKDTLTILALSIAESGIKITEAFKEPEDAIARLASIIKDPKQFQLFSKEDQNILINYGDEITRLNAYYEQNKKKVSETRSEVQKLREEYNKLILEENTAPTESSRAAATGQRRRVGDELEKKQAQLDQQQATLDSVRFDVAQITAKFPDIAARQLSLGADMLATSIAAAFAKGTTSFTNAVLASVGDLPGTAQRRYEMEMRKLNSEADLIKVQIAMLQATHLNTVALKQRTVEDVKYRAQSDLKESKGQDTEAAARLEKANKDLQDLMEQESIYKIDPSNALQAIEKIKSAALNGNQVIAADSAQMFNYLASVSGLAVQQRNNIDAKAAAQFTKQRDLLKEQYGETAKVLGLEQARNALVASDLALSKAKNGALTESERSLERQQQIEAANLDAAVRNLAIAQEIAVLELAKKTGQIDNTAANTRIKQLGEQAINNALKAREGIAKANIDYVIQELAIKKEIFDQELRINQARKQGTDASKEAQNKLINIESTTAAQTKQFTPEFQTQQEAELAAINLRYQTEKDLAALRDEQKIKSFELSQEISKLEQLATTEEGKRRLQAKKDELDAITSAYSQREQAIQRITAAELSSIQKIEAARKETQAFDSLLEGIKNLEDAFGSLGTGLGKVVSAFRDASKSQKQYNENISVLQQKLMVTKEDSQEYAEIESSLAKQRSLQARSEISDYGKIAGSAKSMFKEKSTGYKILAGIEKAMHIARLAMDVAEIVSDRAKTASATANSGTRSSASILEAGVDAVAAVVKAIASLPFPLNLAAGAATAAVVGALVSQIGAESPSVAASSAGFTAEDRQQTQGTGMSWIGGSQVENGGGVFGDPTEKLNSINRGIETLNDNTIEGLYYDNRMVKAMEAVAESMTGVASALFALPGTTTGLNFGTQAGTWASGGGLLNKIFGGDVSTTKAIEDVGVQLRGSLETLIASQFKDIVTTTTESGGWFGSDSTFTSRNRETQALGNDINTAFVDIFKGAKDMFTEIGSLAGISAQTVTDVFRNTKINLDISLKGLSGTRALEEINAVISSQLDILSKNLFSSFDQFRKFGEGYTDTVVRVVDGNIKVATAVSAMGLATETLTGDFESTERVINNMAGSLQKFTEQAKFFIDNFLTEVERTALIRSSVEQSFADMGLPAQLTREQFKSLVQMQDLTTESGRIMYQGLMNIQESFFKITERIEDLKTKGRDLEIELLKVTGNTELAQLAIDALATEGMTQAELAAYNYNKTLEATIEAAKEAERIEAQKLSIEQKIFQSVGDLVAIRSIELEKLDESNRELQVAAWLVEDYTKAITQSSAEIEKAIQLIAQTETAIQNIQTKATDAYLSATDKVSQAQLTIANLSIEAAKKMQELGKTLREFISTELTPNTSANNAMFEFSKNIATALTGDTTAIQKVPELARAAIDAAKASASSSEQFNAQRAAILSEVVKVAKAAEDRAALTEIPIDADPLVEANKNLQAAIEEQTKALDIANKLGASLVKTPEDLVGMYNQAVLDLADAISQKTELELARARSQKALDDLVSNTGTLIEAIRGGSQETKKLALIVQEELLKATVGLDANVDGLLTYEELVVGLRGKATDTEIKNLIKSVDLNADTVIDGYELELFNSTKSIVEALGDGFSLLDTNLDGKVSEAEFIKAMTGKASDAALKSIFDLVDGDNDKLITATELTAAKSAITADKSTVTATSTDKVLQEVTLGNVVTAAGAIDTSNAIAELNNANLLTITSNTATSVKALDKLLVLNDDLFRAMNSVAKSTSALADAVKSGSGGGTVTPSSSGANAFLGVFGKAVDAVGNVVNAAVNVVSNVVDAVGSGVSHVANTVSNWVSSWFSDIRTKKDISLAAKLSNGISLYDFSYKAPYSEIYGTDRKRGVLAQEVMGDYPQAVTMSKNGMYMVDYSKLPVPMDMLKFATGGVFSNNVITRPTGFELGMLGEAGPEAIMPLSRTSSGKLGVVAQTAPVDNTTREMLKQNAQLVAEVKHLREEVSLLRYEARATATATTKTTKILERVTQNGDSLLVTDTATV